MMTAKQDRRQEPVTTASQRSPGRPREIDRIYRAPERHWVGDGFLVAGYLSRIPDAARRLDPFLLLDYHPKHEYAATDRPRGVGVHPHRGFETVTLAWQGRVAHHDSTGAGGVIGPGDVQWMTAASGVLHKEYHEKEWASQGGPFHMAQLWVNLPAAHKLDPPRYQALTAGQMGMARLPGDAGLVRVIAGEFAGVKGPARTFTPVTVLDARLNPGGKASFDFPAHENAAVLVMQGEVRINGEDAGADDLVLFRNEGERIEVVAGAEAQLLVLAGEPIGEPVVQYGPFVMNTKEEIARALEDFENGKFGNLED
jgi:quercetin 2,3-dioxygenase